ncbi:hypothetical protein EV182_008792, partial [Spiromyces aspiralis]
DYVSYDQHKGSSVDTCKVLKTYVWDTLRDDLFGLVNGSYVQIVNTKSKLSKYQDLELHLRPMNNKARIVFLALGDPLLNDILR